MSRRTLIGVVAALLALALLRYTKPVTLPIAGGLVLAALAWPIKHHLSRVLPRGLALLAAVLAVVLVLLGLAGALGWASADIGKRLLERRDRIEQLRGQVEAAAGRFGISMSSGPRRATTGAGAEPATPTEEEAAAGRAPAPGERVMRAFTTGLPLIALAVGFCALALAETRTARERVRRRLGAASAERTLAIASEVAEQLRRYFVVKSLTSAITGAVTGAIALAFGLDFALVWGLLAFLLEYVPTIGSLLAVIPPALYAATQFDGLARPAALAGTLTVAQLFLGNYVDPRIEGKLLSLSPLVVLASIVLWAWVWGPAGALLGVPMTIALTTVARHFADTRWLWAVLTEGDDEPAGA